MRQYHFNWVILGIQIVALILVVLAFIYVYYHIRSRAGGILSTFLPFGKSEPQPRSTNLEEQEIIAMPVGPILKRRASSRSSRTFPFRTSFSKSVKYLPPNPSPSLSPQY